MLATGHLWADFLQGAVPALLPFLIAERGYSYAAAGALVLASSIGSSLVQPLFGIASDRLSLPWLMPAGLAIGGAGLATVGLTESYPATVAAVAVSGLGVAAFHPEGARYANYVSRAQRGRGMSMFSLGGNAGFALGPLLVTPAVLAFGLHGTLLVADPAVARRGAARPRTRAAARLRARDLGQWAPPGRRRLDGARRVGAVRAPRVADRPAVGGVLRAAGVHPGLLRGRARHERGGRERGAERDARRGAVGTYLGGRLVDRLGRRVIVVGSMAALGPLLVLLQFAERWPATLLLAGIGFVVIANFSITIVMGQEYLPNRLGLAGGITMGAAIGFGGLAAAVLGALADATSLQTAMWTIAVLPFPALLVALSLPPTDTDRRLRADAARAGAQEVAPASH